MFSVETYIRVDVVTGTQHCRNAFSAIKVTSIIGPVN